MLACRGVSLRLVFVVLLLAPALAAAQGEALPPGCEATPTGYACEWAVPLGASPGTDVFVFPVPSFAMTLANVTVDFRGVDNGYYFQVVDAAADEKLFMHQYPGAVFGLAVSTTEFHHTIAAYFDVPAGAPVELRFVPRPLTVTEEPAVESLHHSRGDYRIRYEITPRPEGVAPRRPAATADDPHLLDESADAAAPAMDVVAFWFDDARIGDAIFEAHLRVADLTQDAEPSALAEVSNAVVYDAHFTVSAQHYRLTWTNDRGRLFCQFVRFLSDDVSYDALSQPRCTEDEGNATLHAEMMESEVGFPGPGALFTDMRIVVISDDPGRADAGQLVDGRLNGEGGYHVEDKAEGERYAFALGSEATWDELNPRLKVPEPVLTVQAQSAPPPWYQAPFARANLPDTLQVGGAAVGVATFLVGAALVARRRRGIRRYLDEVDAIERRHLGDAETGIARLHEVERRFVDLVRRGRLTPEEHQVLAQHVAGAERRLGASTSLARR